MVPRLSFWQRLRALYAFLASQEPARVQAFWKALIGIAIAAGVTVPDWLEPRVSAIIAAVYVVLLFWTASSTRKRVVPSDNVPSSLWSSTLRAAPPRHAAQLGDDQTREQPPA